MAVYCIDFDGCLCVDAYPEIGAPDLDVINFCKSLRRDGHKLILWTCREGEQLREAVNWCADKGLIFDAHNANLPERIALYGTDPRKIGADYYIDDHNLDIWGGKKNT